MRILDNRDLADQHVYIKRCSDADVWELVAEDGSVIAQASSTAKLSRYAMDRCGALKCTTQAWAGYHWRNDL